MKKLSIFILFLMLFLFTINVSAQTKFYTTEQIMNKVLNTTENTLKTTSTVSGSVEVSASSYTNTIFKRFTLTSNTDSGDSLSFGTEVSSWIILNMADTAEVFIKFDGVATASDFKIQAGSGLGGTSKVTNIHCFTLGDSVEVQAVGYYN